MPLFFPVLAGEQREKNQQHNGISKALEIESNVETYHLFSALSIFLQSNGSITEKNWRKNVAKGYKTLQISTCLQAMQQAKLYFPSPISFYNNFIYMTDNNYRQKSLL